MMMIQILFGRLGCDSEGTLCASLSVTWGRRLTSSWGWEGGGEGEG